MRTLITACTALLLALAVPPHAGAQGIVLSDPAIDGDERDCIVMTLALDDEQTDTLDDLLAVYASEAAELSDSFSNMEEGNRFDETNMDEALAFMRELSAETEALRDTLFDDLALMLSDEQASRIAVARQRSIG